MTPPKKEIPFAKGYYMLRDEGVKPKPRPSVEGGLLPLSDLRTANSVFQPRTGEGTQAASAAHISALCDGVRVAVDHRLDPILVWWSGKYWRVVDGHHRLAAYQQVSKPDQKKQVVVSTVPVEVFEGNLDEAIAEAVRRNSKDKLPMTKPDKLERAWKLTTLGTMTIPRISQITGVAERTVSNMRKAKEELSKVDETDFGPRFNPMEMTWAEAKRRQPNEIPKDDGWLERQAKEAAKKLGKTFGATLARNPELTLRALEIYSATLPQRLLELWKDDTGQGDDEADTPDHPQTHHQ